jgi:hypothetical protein
VFGNTSRILVLFERMKKQSYDVNICNRGGRIICKQETVKQAVHRIRLISIVRVVKIKQGVPGIVIKNTACLLPFEARCLKTISNAKTRYHRYQMKE